MLLLILLYNLAVFGLYAFDQRQAQRGGRRVPERRLFTLALCGGAPGAFAGVFLLRHKRRKRSFATGVPLLLAAQAALLLWGSAQGWW